MMKLMMKKAPTTAASAHASGLIFQTSLGSKYDQIANLQFAKATGTTAGNTTDEADISYPSGYSHGNCVIIGNTVQFSNGAWFSNYEDNYVYANNSGIHVKVGLTGFTNKSVIVMLMKIPS